MIKQIGPHRVCHGDIHNLDVNALTGGKKVDIFYSDPPWGNGNLKYWQTINHKMTGAPKRDVDLIKFLKQVFTVAVKVTEGPVFIEYGKRWQQELIDMATTFGLKPMACIEMMYRGGDRLLPLDLHVFSKTRIEIPQSYHNKVYHTHGMKAVHTALSLTKGKSILDPCCGMGNTAKFAVKNNMTFYGNELNSKRLDLTIKVLEKAVK